MELDTISYNLYADVARILDSNITATVGVVVKHSLKWTQELVLPDIAAYAPLYAMECVSLFPDEITGETVNRWIDHVTDAPISTTDKYDGVISVGLHLYTLSRNHLFRGWGDPSYTVADVPHFVRSLAWRLTDDVLPTIANKYELDSDAYIEKFIRILSNTASTINGSR